MPFGDNFGEFFESMATVAKNTAKSAASSVKSQTIGTSNSSTPGSPDAHGGSGFGGSDFSALNSYEQNSLKQQQQSMLAKLGQNQSPSSALSTLAGNNQPDKDQAKTLQNQQQLQRHLQTHKAKYYIPTFEQGPMKIRQEREQRYQAMQQQEEQKKQQMHQIEEQKKQDQVAATMRTRREGEGAKITG